MWGMWEEPRSERGWAAYLRRRIRFGEARCGRWLVWRDSRGESLRVEDREVRTVVAAVETAREKVRREGMWLSTTGGRLKSVGPRFRIPSFGSFFFPPNRQSEIFKKNC